jgi:hypothetical protein
MSLMYEQLARARHQELVEEARRQRLVRAVASHRRWKRRADRASLRARLALNSL